MKIFFKKKSSLKPRQWMKGLVSHFTFQQMKRWNIQFIVFNYFETAKCHCLWLFMFFELLFIITWLVFVQCICWFLIDSNRYCWCITGLFSIFMPEIMTTVTKWFQTFFLGIFTLIEIVCCLLYRNLINRRGAVSHTY